MTATIESGAAHTAMSDGDTTSAAGWATTAAWAAAVLGLVAGVVHVVEAGDHAEHWWEAGVFFIVVAAVQVGTALTVVRPAVRTKAALAAIAVHAVTVVVYLISRRWGIPFAPTEYHHGKAADPGLSIVAHNVEAIGVYDLSVAAIQVIAVALLVALLPAAWRSRCLNALAAVGVALWAAAFFIR